MDIDGLIDKIIGRSHFGARGYNDIELGFIENLYDIKLGGVFKQFLSSVGRSSGCAFKDLGYEYYFDLWVCKSVRINVLGNKELGDEIRKIVYRKAKEDGVAHNSHPYDRYLKLKPFMICLENQTATMFILTAENDPIVYMINESEDDIVDTGETFVSYVNRIIDWQKTDYSSDKDWFGELLIPKYT